MGNTSGNRCTGLNTSQERARVYYDLVSSLRFWHPIRLDLPRLLDCIQSTEIEMCEVGIRSTRFIRWFGLVFASVQDTGYTETQGF